MGDAVYAEFVTGKVGFEEEFIENCRVVLFIIESVGTGGLDSCYLILVLLRIMRVSLHITKRRSLGEVRFNQHLRPCMGTYWGVLILESTKGRR